MGTNWVSCVDEAARVVRWGGEAWVAEIKSRFARVGNNKGQGGIGKAENGSGRNVKKRKKKGAGIEDDDNGIDDDDIVEVDSDPDILVPGKGDKSKRGRDDETDVGPFVEVWRRRGFELKGEADLSNKMFVRMRFVKRGASKGNEETLGQATVMGKMGAKSKFIESENHEMDSAEEAKVLKPCLYKLR